PRHHRSRSHLSRPRRQAATLPASARGHRRRRQWPRWKRTRPASTRHAANAPDAKRTPNPQPRTHHRKKPADEEEGEPKPEDFDDDEDDMENSLSLAAMEAELKAKVLETFDLVAPTYKKLRKLQDQVVERALKNDQLSSGQEKLYKVLKDESV